jgi:hypothetical protein
MAKSVLDASWSMLRTQLQYKGDSVGSWVRQVNEAYSTQECSCCHARTGPKGLEGLAVRQWACTVCQSEHDRDCQCSQEYLGPWPCVVGGGVHRWGEAKASEAAVNKGVGAGATTGAGHGPLVAGIIAPSGR